MAPSIHTTAIPNINKNNILIGFTLVGIAILTEQQISGTPSAASANSSNFCFSGLTLQPTPSTLLSQLNTF
jgi:hypothetical protein